MVRLWLVALVRHLARDPAALDPLQKAGAIPKLVRQGSVPRHLIPFNSNDEGLIFDV